MNWSDAAGLAFAFAMGLPFGALLGAVSGLVDRWTGYRVLGAVVGLAGVLAILGVFSSNGFPLHGERVVGTGIILILMGALSAHVAVWQRVSRR
mgnify:CR=1 FL=1